MKQSVHAIFIACLHLCVVSCATANAEQETTSQPAAVVNEQEAKVSEESQLGDNPVVEVAQANTATDETTSEQATVSEEEKFSELLGAVKTLKGKFSQELLDQSGKSLQKTDGTFKVLRPGYFYWEVNPPYQQIVVGTPHSLKIYDPDLEQMTIQESASLSGTPAAFMSGESSAIFSDYALTKTVKEKIIDYTFTLKPGSDASFAKIQFVFDRSNDETPFLSYLSFVDKLGQETQVQLSALELNIEIDAAAFQFIAPEGTDIIVDG